MNNRTALRELLSMGLAAALFLCPVTPALATEIAEESIPAEIIQETTSPTELSEPVEPTAPAETEVPTEPTVPAETTEPATPPETTEPPETTAPEETTEPPETTVPEETPETTAPPEPSTPAAVTVAQALSMASGTRDISVQGTVVYALGVQAVLQDHTGGIRLSFPEDPGIAPGQMLLVTGRRSNGLFVSDFELLGTAQLPAVETDLLNAPENLRVLIQNANISEGSLGQQGLSLSLAGDLPQIPAENPVDAYGVILDGRFYADTFLPAAASTAGSADPTAGSTEPTYQLYFGLLHAHTDISDGTGSVEETFLYASETPRLDFFAVTDHSDSFENANFGSLLQDGTTVSKDWTRGKAAAASVTDDTFVGIYGYEMSWPEDKGIGHISTFNTKGWQTWTQSSVKKLPQYYEALIQYDEPLEIPDSISQFNHPGPFYGDFQRFANYKPEYDRVMHLIEVGIVNEENPANKEDYYKAYTKALDEGWHLAPSHNQNDYEGRWGDEDSVRTVVLASELTEDAIYDAIRNHRVYATEDSDLEIRYSLSGNPMGTISGPIPSPIAEISLSDVTDGTEGTTVEVITSGGMTAAAADSGADGILTIPVPEGYPYYYLRVTQPDGDVAVTAPVWVDSYEDIGIQDFSSDNDYPIEEDDVTLTLVLYNDEPVDFTLESIEFWADGQLLQSLSRPGTLSGLSTLTYPQPYTRPEAGESELLVKVTGTVAGERRTYEETMILYFQPREPLVTRIASARSGVPGQAYHVKGYVTAGNSNPYNAFDQTLYLQDDSGGLAIVGDLPANVQIGTPLSVIGVLRKQGGNLVLDATKATVTEDSYFRFEPRAMSNSTATDYTTNGGELIQVEGTLVSMNKDGKIVSRFTIRDLRGDLVTVVIDDNIRSGAYGVNELAGILKKGRTIRAVGLLHVDEFQQTVLRVRNCDEVVYVPPKADPTNPRTGDWFWFLS